jgi:glycosyltransferase involved in cell wall biosynthesis
MPYSSSIAASSGQEIAEVINPMKMFEYMAVGRPIISADLPAIREVLNDSMAVYCPPGDVGAWKSAVVARPIDRRAALAKRRREVEKYTWLKAHGKR